MPPCWVHTGADSEESEGSDEEGAAEDSAAGGSQEAAMLALLQVPVLLAVLPQSRIQHTLPTWFYIYQLNTALR